MLPCAVVPTGSFIRAGQHVAEPDNLGGAFLRALRLRRQLRPCRGTLRLLVSSIRWPDEDTGDAIGGLVIRVPAGAFASVVVVTGRSVPRRCWSTFVTPSGHDCVAVGPGSRVVAASLALGSPVLPWPAEVIAPLAMACLASLRVLLQAAQRFASSAGYLGQSSSTGSRRGGDKCTAAACGVVLVLTGGWLLAGKAGRCVIARLGRLVLFRGAGAIVLSRALFLGGFACLSHRCKTEGLFRCVRGLACWWHLACPLPSTTQFGPKTLTRLPCRLPPLRSPVAIA